ncbi:MAG TPA: ImmA/IrrE family metallo-endopeptidase [Candidatus Aquicultor sp.]
MKWLIDIAMHIGQFISSPAANLPDLGLPTDPLLISDDDIENAAQDARRYWGMGDSPIGNMILLLENQGVFTARLELGAESLDSLSMLDPEDGRPYIILGTDKGTAVRWRFDAAHELGHLLLHQHVNKRILARTADFKRIEEQAHRFAAAFLLPMEPFCEDLFAVSLDAMRAMKPRWKVSIALMIMRARQAGFLSEEAEKRLWTNLSRRQWRRQEPYDLEMPAEEPRLLRRATEMLLSSGMQTIEDLTANTQLSSADIERLVGFPLGYLTNDFTPINIIQRQPINTPSQSGASARVIQLKSRKNETDHNA